MPGYPTGTVTFLFTDVERSTSLWERDAALARGGRRPPACRHPRRRAEQRRRPLQDDRRRHAVGLRHRAAGRRRRIGRAARSDRRRRGPAPRRGRACAWRCTPAPPSRRTATTSPAASTAWRACSTRPMASRSCSARRSSGSPAMPCPRTPASRRWASTACATSCNRRRSSSCNTRRCPTTFPPLNTPGVLPHNLPNHPTPFLGRERELEEIEALLMQPGVRLVTLTGPGGVGKTRLALRVAAESLEAFPDGVFLVDLARQTDPALVPSATATALGLREQPGQTLTETLVTHLRDKRMLLFFDNFEHLLPAATLVADLLAAAPGVTVLATSRARLGLQAEHEYRVETLPVPDLEKLPPLEDLAQLRRRRPLRLAGAGAAPQFCADRAERRGDRRDRLPARRPAARHRVGRGAREAPLPGGVARPARPPADDADRRRARSAGAAAHPARHDRLEPRPARPGGTGPLPPAQRLRRRLDAGGQRRPSPPVPARRPIESLARVVGAGRPEPRRRASPIGDRADEPRFTMLETIREFAVEQLAASGEMMEVERAFEEFLIARAEAAEEGLKGPDQPLWLGRLEEEHDNLRAGLGRILERRAGATALPLATSLWRFWRYAGYPGEGRSWLERSLAVAVNPSSETIADAEFGLGKLSIDLGDFVAAEAHFRRCIALRRPLQRSTCHR